jgi:hypothetical protein
VSWRSQVSLDYTARAALDYAPTLGSLVFAPGQTEMRIDLVIRGDNSHEAVEAFIVLLTGFIHVRPAVPLNFVRIFIFDDD